MPIYNPGRLDVIEEPSLEVTMDRDLVYQAALFAEPDGPSAPRRPEFLHLHRLGRATPGERVDHERQQRPVAQPHHSIGADALEQAARIHGTSHQLSVGRYVSGTVPDIPRISGVFRPLRALNPHILLAFHTWHCLREAGGVSSNLATPTNIFNNLRRPKVCASSCGKHMGSTTQGNKRACLGKKESQERPEPCSTHTAFGLGTPPEPEPDGNWMLVISPSSMTSHTENDTNPA